MTAKNRKLRTLTLDIGGAQYQAQVTSFKLTNNTDDSEITYTFVPGEEFADNPDPDWSLSVTFVSDWTVSGISTYLTQHDGETVTFTLDLHPDVPGERGRWAGQLSIKAPDVGGDVRTTEKTEVEFKCVGKPVYTRP